MDVTQTVQAHLNCTMAVYRGILQSVGTFLVFLKKEEAKLISSTSTGMQPEMTPRPKIAYKGWKKVQAPRSTPNSLRDTDRKV